jgi:hypothetical protein
MNMLIRWLKVQHRGRAASVKKSQLEAVASEIRQRQKCLSAACCGFLCAPDRER